MSLFVVFPNNRPLNKNNLLDYSLYLQNLNKNVIDNINDKKILKRKIQKYHVFVKYRKNYKIIKDTNNQKNNEEFFLKYG